MRKRERVAHILKKNYGEEFPRCWIFFDIETSPVPLDDRRTEQKFKLMWSCYVEFRKNRVSTIDEYRFFDNNDVFWNYVDRRAIGKTKLMLCAHNCVVDFMALDGFQSLHHRGWRLESHLSDKNVQKWTWKKLDKTLVLIDSGNYFKTSLEEIGRVIGLEKKKINFYTCSYEELKDYCYRDVEILVEVFKHYYRFHQEHELGVFAPTVASQAFNAFRHAFMHHDIYIHLDDTLDAFERQAYYGGRVECLRIGRQEYRNYRLLDVNSLYPYVMLQHDVPIKFVAKGDRIDTARLRELMSKYFVIAEVKLNAKHNYYPFRAKNKLIFPLGTFSTTLCSPELQLALDNYEITDIFHFHVYDKANVFADYVKYFYSLRRKYKEEHNTVFEHFCKLMLNSLYGKFAQRGGEWVTLGHDDPDKIEYSLTVNDKGHHGVLRIIFGLIEECNKEQMSFNTLTAIAAAVTSYARVHLLKLMLKADMYHIYYCDTDSLIVDDEGFYNLQDEIDKDELGKLKIEAQDYELNIITCKSYVFGGRLRAKGLSRSAVKIDESTYEQEHWPSFHSLLQAGIIDKYYTVKVRKRFSNAYDKGVVLADGRVIPHFLVDNQPISGKI